MMEASPNQIAKEEKTTSLETTNLMQLALAEESGLDITDWINQYASKFRALVEKEPVFINDYEKKPEETLRLVSTRLQEQLH